MSITAMGWSAVGDLNSNWGGEQTTGWIGSYQGAPGGDATQNVTQLTDGFLSPSSTARPTPSTSTPRSDTGTPVDSRRAPASRWCDISVGIPTFTTQVCA